MATIKSYSDLQQSKKLAKILPLESADMTYYRVKTDWRNNPVDSKWGKPVNMLREELALPASNFTAYEYLPCWSLAALLDVLPNGIVMYKYSQSGRYHFSSKYIGTSVTADNPVDACVNMIEKLNELNLL